MKDEILEKLMQSPAEFHITIENADKTALDHLAEATAFSRQKIKQFMQKGCVWLEHQNASNPTNNYIQRLRRSKKVMYKGDTLHFYYDENVLSTEPKTATLISDEGAYSVWNKPSGMFSQGSKWGDHCTIYRWAEKHLKPERPAFIVHRLDRAANGLILLAHKKTVAAQFSKIFEQRQLEKVYQVLVEGDFTTAMLGNEDRLTIREAIDDKTAISHIELIGFNQMESTSLLKVEIETGRKHQIRKHLSAQGFPVVGDRLYGSGEYACDLQLSAIELHFTCPITQQELTFSLNS